MPSNRIGTRYFGVTYANATAAPIARAASPDGNEYDEGCAMTVSGAGSGPGAFARASNGRGRRRTTFAIAVDAHAVRTASTTAPDAAAPGRSPPREPRRAQ